MPLSPAHIEVMEGKVGTTSRYLLPLKERVLRYLDRALCSAKIAERPHRGGRTGYPLIGTRYGAFCNCPPLRVGSAWFILMKLLFSRGFMASCWALDKRAEGLQHLCSNALGY